jgi:hypothetical protein
MEKRFMYNIYGIRETAIFAPMNYDSNEVVIDLLETDEHYEVALKFVPPENEQLDICVSFKSKWEKAVRFKTWTTAETFFDKFKLYLIKHSELIEMHDNLIKEFEKQGKEYNGKVI